MSLRKIDIGNRVRLNADGFDGIELKWLDIDDLRINGRLHRELSKSNWRAIEKIAHNFSWARFSPCLVSPVDGGLYAVIDGQHRTHGAKRAGYDRVPCMVVPMGLAEQAASFSWVNGNVTKITAFHVYKAALAAQEEWAVTCRDAVEAGGCKLMGSNASAKAKKTGEIYAIKLIREHCDVGRGAVVTLGLEALTESGAADDALYFTATILRPWLSAISVEDHYLRVDLIEFLKSVDLLDIEASANTVLSQSRDRTKTKRQLMHDHLVLALKAFEREAAA